MVPSLSTEECYTCVLHCLIYFFGCAIIKCACRNSNPPPFFTWGFPQPHSTSERVRWEITSISPKNWTPLGIELRPAAPHPRVSTELTQVIHCHLENPPIFRWYKKTQVKSVDLWMRINVNHTLPLRKEKISYSQTLLTSTFIYVSRWNRGATFVIIGSADPDKF
jgi:hypothetical protein